MRSKPLSYKAIMGSIHTIAIGQSALVSDQIFKIYIYWSVVTNLLILVFGMLQKIIIED